VVADAIVSALEALPEARFRVEAGGPDRQLAGHVFDLGFVLRRVTPARRAELRARLEAIWSRHHDGSQAWEVMTALDAVLHGAAALRRSKPTYVYLDTYAHVHDDPELVRAVVADKETVYADLDVQFVYIAGREALGLLGKHRPRAEEVPRFLEDIGKVESPIVASLMLDYVGKKSAKDAPMKWFRAHEAFARPILEAARGETAKMVLASLATPT
jgi:hypothetical protein